MNATPLLRVDAVSKAFSGIPVLREVGFALGPGRVLGLVGENGAGKSTLMNILGGVIAPDQGTLALAGRPYAPRSPIDAARAGIGFVHQELSLFPNLSIAENLFLTTFPRRGRWPGIDRAGLRARASALLAEVGLALPPTTSVERLATGERQLVEIARAVGADTRLLILDEPTTSLSVTEIARLFDLLERLRRRGWSMIYISHALDEVLRLSDELLILRDGQVVGQGPRAGFTRDRLVTLMVGRSLQQLFPPRTGPRSDTPLLEVDGLSHPGTVRNLHLRVHAGEVVGVAGLMGSGRSELARLIFGLDCRQRGVVRIGGERLAPGSTRAATRQRMAFVTEDRRAEGLCLEASIADNLSLVGLPAFTRRGTGWLRRGALEAALRRIREAVRLTVTARDPQPVRTLSGGNQQKVVFGKWLLTQPRVLLLDEPTRGIDVGARQEIYRIIRELTAAGAGVLLISSELAELIGLSDRILVMRRGSLVAEHAAAPFDREALLRDALGAVREGSASRVPGEGAG